MRSRITRWVGGLLLLCLLGGGTSADAKPLRPNIIFVLADDLGYGELGCYGQRLIATPNIDRLAAEGMRFTRFYAGSTVCAPSRSVLLTGLHTGHTRVRGNGGSTPLAQTLRTGDRTLPETLHTAGYKTALIGKWGLGDENSEGTPNRKGFDYFYGYLHQVHAHNPYPEFVFRNEQRVPLRNGLSHRTPPDIQRVGGGWSVVKRDYVPDLMTREALRWVEQNAEQSFFLYWSLITPHANNEAYRATGDGQEVPTWGIYADKPWARADKGHAAMITRLDADLGRMMALLKRLELDEDTLIVFTSDNGPHNEGGNHVDFFNARGGLRGIKRALYEGGIRMPTIARWTGSIRAGAISDLSACFADFLPTFAELSGVRPPPRLDGVSLVPTLLGRGVQKLHPTLYWEFHEIGFSQAVIMDGRWKALRHFHCRAPIELYDLNSDAFETRDLASQQPALVRRAARLFETERTDTPDWVINDAYRRER